MSTGQTVNHLKRRQRAIRYTAPALEKGLDILELLAGDSVALTRSEIAHRLRRTIGEVFRMLVCLDERGYICQVGADERYQLTLKFFELAQKHHPLQRLVAAAKPLMQQVAETTGQSCHLAMLSHSEVIVVAQVDSPGKMGFAVRLGANIDLLDTASGHVILAFQKKEVQMRILRAWQRRSDKRPPRNLYRHLDAIRHRGHEELASYQVRGVVNISFPVLNQQGEAVGAMAVPYLQQIGARIGLSQVKQELLKVSENLSLAIGGRRARLLSGIVRV
ncbi:MAG TPA: IclR family transcriptional regulator [Terriglobales bacterium]|nr:IclR family transcriptional regulator [Terriglobales bacterium]